MRGYVNEEARQRRSSGGHKTPVDVGRGLRGQAAGTATIGRSDAARAAAVDRLHAGHVTGATAGVHLGDTVCTRNGHAGDAVGQVVDAGHVGDHQGAALEQSDVDRGSLGGGCHASASQDGQRDQGLFHGDLQMKTEAEFLCTSIKVFREPLSNQTLSYACYIVQELYTYSFLTFFSVTIHHT